MISIYETEDDQIILNKNHAWIKTLYASYPEQAMCFYHAFKDKQYATIEEYMKYRIKQVGNSFYPQFQVVWPLWLSFYSGESEDEYDSLKDATEYLDRRVKNDYPQNEIVHNYP